MEHLADRGATGGELRARSHDVGDNQIVALSGARRGRRDVRAELDRAGRARWRELDDAEAVSESVVGVQPPSELFVEVLGAIDVGHGDDDDLEFLIDRRVAHCDLPAAFAASAPRLSPSTRLNAGNGWMTSASAFSGMPSLMASTSSPRISPARGVTSVAPTSTPRAASATSLSAPR